MSWLEVGMGLGGQKGSLGPPELDLISPGVALLLMLIQAIPPPNRDVLKAEPFSIFTLLPACLRVVKPLKVEKALAFFATLF